MRYAQNNCTISRVDLGTIRYTGKCIVTGKEYSVDCPAHGVFSALGGELIQEAFPNMSADDREFLISGTSPEGWAKLFPQNQS